MKFWGKLVCSEGNGGPWKSPLNIPKWELPVSEYSMHSPGSENKRVVHYQGSNGHFR